MIIVGLFVAVVTISGACPPWTYKSRSSDQCQCGESLGEVVLCDGKKVSVLAGYCMTYNEHLNKTLVGQCVTSIKQRKVTRSQYIDINTADVHSLNNVTCQDFNRTGQLCGKCVEGYGPPVYSYSLKCVGCSESHFKYNLLKYIAVAFRPLTLFYLVVVFFKISVTSGSMTVYVMKCQIVATTANIKMILTADGANKPMISLIALWNLDILCSVYTPFCIHPKMTALQVIMLDYLVGVYPLFLIFLTYIAVSLHDRYSLVVNMWRPAYKCLSYFRKEWDIRGSLVQAFATFLVLSYVKILNVSFDLLTPVYLWNMEGKYLKQPYLYNDGEVLYFGREHLPYGILAIMMLTVFNILPMILLLAYPCNCFQKCLNYCGLHSHTLHTFMDAFQGCYHHHPRDCRYFSALYLFLRVISLLTFALIRDEQISATFTGSYFIILVIVLTYQKPYKNNFHNKIDVTLVLFAVWATLINATKEYYPFLHTTRPVIVLMLLIANCIYGTFYIYFIILCLRYFLPKKLFTGLRDCCRFICTIMRKRDIAANDDMEESLPHRGYTIRMSTRH